MPTYEMLWNCPSCGAEKLLGKTHRHCPACGSAQDPAARYFPAEGEEVAVEDHQYVGADKACGACDTPNAANSAFCSNCGSSLDDAKGVRLKQDEANRAAEAAAAEAPPGRKGAALGLIGAVIAGGFALLCLGLVVSMLWTREATVTAVSHGWTRSVEVEELQLATEEAWCDELPAGARETRRFQADRGTRTVPDGEDCRTVRVDQGDGTFRTEEQCTPKTREEAIRADRCAYEVEAWKRVRVAKAEGRDLAPSWPSTGVQACPSPRLGCQREGARTEENVVTFRAEDGTTADCPFPEATWRRFEDGARYKGAAGVVGGGIRCGSLDPAQRG